MRKPQVSWLVLLVGFGVLLVGMLYATFSSTPPIAWAACDGNRLFLGSYYLLPDDSSHPDFEQALQLLAPVTGQLQTSLGANGLPVPTSPNPPISAPNTSIRQFDWYTAKYQAFTRLDNNPLAFSNYGVAGTTPFFGASTTPAASQALPTTKDLFAVQWRANVVVPPGGLSLPYSIGLDDAGWVFVDGQLALDYGGIHPPQTFTGTFNVPEGQHTVDIFYADRHTTNAVITFQLSNLTSLLACGSPTFDVVKSVTPTGNVSPGDVLTYTVRLTNSGNFTATNVLISDTLPANTTFIAATPAQSSGPAPDNTLRWQIPGALPPTASAQVTFTVRVNPGTAPGTVIANAASVTSKESGGVAFQSNSVTNNVANVQNVTINKTAVPPPGAVLQGNNITYSLLVTNNGNTTTGQINVTDAIPTGTTFVSASPAPTTAPPFNGTGNVVWTIPNLPPGQATTVNMTVRVTGNPGSVVTNQATAQSSASSATSPLISHQVQASADVAVNKQARFSLPVAPNALVTYVIVASNAGPSPATNVVVSDTLQAGLTLDAATSPVPDAASVAPNYRWTFPNLAVGDTRLITVVARVGAVPPATFSNTAVVSAPPQDVQPGNNSSTADVPGNNAPNNVSFSKPNVNAPNQIAPGEIFTYTLTFVNNETNPINNVLISDTIPAGVTILYSNPPAYSPVANTYVWNIGTVGANQTATVLIYAQLAASAPPGTSITNNAVTTFGNPAVLANTRNASTNTNIVAAADLAISKELISGTTFTPGQNLTFRINVRNNSATNAATNVVISDTLPVGTSFVSANPAPANTSPLTFNLTSVPPNTTVPIEVVIAVPINYAVNSLTNSASGSAAERDLAPDNNNSSVSVPAFNISAALVLNKTAPSSVSKGATFNYVIRVTNTTNATLNNVVVSDVLPTGLIFVAAVPTPSGTNPYTWTFPTILPNGVVDIVLTVQVSQNYSQTTINNEAGAIASNFGGQARSSSGVNTVNVQAPRATSTPAVTVRAATATPTFTPAPTSAAEQGTPTPTAIAIITETAVPTAVATETTTPGVTETPIATPTETPMIEETATATTTPAITPEMEVTPGTLPGLPNTGKTTPEAAAKGTIIWAWFVLILVLIGAGSMGILYLLYNKRQT